MSLNTYISRIKRLDDLIRRKSTGTPKELAEKLNISERWLYVLLEELREEFDCPIVYDRTKRSYKYSKNGRMMLGFKKDLGVKKMTDIYGGNTLKISLSLYL